MVVVSRVIACPGDVLADQFLGGNDDGTCADLDAGWLKNQLNRGLL